MNNDLGWWHMAKRKKMQLLWNPRKSWRCFFAASWYPTDLKCVKKKFRNASKNLLTCAWLAIRKNLSYILDHSVVRQQAINISYICSLPVIQSWQLHAILVLVGLGHVSTITSYFKSSLRGVLILEPGQPGQHIADRQTSEFLSKTLSTFPFVSQDSESQMVNDFNSSDGLATEGLSWYLV